MTRELRRRDQRLRQAFAGIHQDMTDLVNHLRYFNARLGTQEKQNKQLQENLGALQQQVSQVLLALNTSLNQPHAALSRRKKPKQRKKKK